MATRIFLTPASSSIGAGSTLTINVAALHDNGTADSTATSTVSLVAASGPSVIFTPSSRQVTLVSGEASFTVRGFTAGTVTISGTAASLEVVNAVYTIVPGPAAALGFGTEPTVVAGVATNLNIEVQDQYGNRATSAASTSATVTVTGDQSGTGVIRPSPNPRTVTITNGLGQVQLQTFLAEELTVHLQDSASTGYTVASDIFLTVQPGPASRMSSTLDVSSQTVGQNVVVSVQLFDQYDNLAANQDESILFALSPAGTSGSITITGGEGSQAISETIAQEYALTFTDTNGIDTSSAAQSITFTAGPVAAFELSVPSTLSVDQNISVQVVGRDAFDNIADSTSGPITLFTEFASQRTNIAASITLGLLSTHLSHLKTVGAAIVGVAADASFGTPEVSAAVELTPGATKYFVLSNATSGVNGFPAAQGSADTNATALVRAYDAFDNLATNHTATAVMAVSGRAFFSNNQSTQAITFVQGTASLVLYDRLAETVILSMQSSSASGATLASAVTITFVPGAAAQLLLGTEDELFYVGIYASITVTLTDAYGNRVTLADPLSVEVATNGTALGGMTASVVSGLGAVYLTSRREGPISVSMSSVNPVGPSIDDTLVLNFANLSSAAGETTRSGVRVRVQLSSADMHHLQLLANLATNASTSQLAYAAGAIADLFGNDLAERLLANSLVPSSFIPDRQPPQVAQAAVNVTYPSDVQEYRLHLTMSEPIVAASIDPTKIQLWSGANPDTSELNYTLTGGAVEASAELVLSFAIKLTEADVTAIFERYYLTGPNQPAFGLARNVASAFITVAADFCLDTAQNTNLPQVETDAFGINSFDGDFQTPFATDATINLTANNIVLTFSEPLNLSIVNVSAVIIQNDPSNPTQSVRLGAQGNAGAQLNGTRLTITLTAQEQNQLRSLEALAVSLNTSYIALDRGCVYDVHGLPSDAILISNALNVSRLDRDEVNPELQSFVLDLDTNQLQLSFSEVIYAASLNPSALYLSNANGSEALAITSPAGTQANSDTMTVNLAPTDINTLKNNLNLGTDVANTYLFSLVSYDYPHGVPSAATDIAVTPVTQDSTAPILAQFVELSYNDATLTLAFSGAVDPQALDLSKITVQSAQETGSYSDGFTSLQLSGGNWSYNASAPEKITVHLLAADINALKTDALLCQYRYNCFITVASAVTSDYSGNDVSATSSAQMVASLRRDTNAPVLETVKINMNLGVLQLSFDEPVALDSLNMSCIEFTTPSGADFYRLTTLHGLRDTQTLANVPLSATDLHSLQARQLAAPTAPTRMRTSCALVQDVSFPTANEAGLITNASSLSVELLVPDTRAPQLVSFELDLDEDPGLITFTFNEPVNASSLDATTMLLQPSADNTSSSHAVAACTLEPEYERDAAVDFVFGQTVFACRLSAADQTAIKSNPHLATSLSTTYLSHAGGLVLDMSGNAAGALSNATAQRARLYVGDSTPARLTSFTLDLSLRELRLTFNDVVDPSSFVAAQITLAASATVVASNSYILTSSEAPGSTGYRVVIPLNANDFFELVSHPSLALSSATTYLQMTAFAFDDVTGVDVAAITTPLAATGFVADVIAPTLTNATVDFVNAQLRLLFSEPLTSVSIDASAVALLSASGSVVAQASNTSTGPLGEATLQLLPTIIQSLKAKRICTPGATCFLNISSAFGLDYWNNANDEELLHAVGDVIPETAAPILLGATLLASNNLTLTFDEPVDVAAAAAVDPTTIEFVVITGHSVAANFSARVVAVGPSASEIIVVLETEACNVLRAASISELASLSMLFSAGAVTDRFGVNSDSGNADVVVEARSPTPAPVNSTYNAGTGSLRLVFDAPIDHTTWNASAVQLCNGTSCLNLPSDTPVERIYSTASWPAIHAPPCWSAGAPTLCANLSYSTTIAVTLTNQFRAQGLLSNIGLSSSTTIVTAAAGWLHDASQVPLAAYTAPVDTLLPDANGPAPLNISLNLTSNVLSLRFDRPVDSSSIDYTLIQLHNASLAFDLAGHAVTLASYDDNRGIYVQLDNAVIADLKTLGILTGALPGTASTLVLELQVGAIASAYNVDSENTTAVVDISAADATPPELVSYVLDLNAKTLQLEFTEPILQDNVNTSLLVLNDVALSTSKVDILNATYPNQQQVVLTLSAHDFAALKTRMPVWSAAATSLDIATGAAQDTANIDATAVTNRLATTVVQDTTAPTLLAFAVDANEWKFYLTFSEPVNASTFSPSSLTLMNLDTPAQTLQLDAGTTSSYTAGFPLLDHVTLTLNASDRVQLQYFSGLYESLNSSMLSSTSGLIQDYGSGNTMTAITPSAPLVAASYVPDTLPAQVLAWQLNLATGEIVFTLSEPLNWSTVDVSRLVVGPGVNASVRLDASGALAFVQFPDVYSLVQELVTATYTLASSELDAIKLSTRCLVSSTCLLHSLTALGADWASIEVAPINDLEPIVLTPDTIAPSFVRFAAFDLNAGTLSLRFNEAINVSSVNATALVLTDSFETSFDLRLSNDLDLVVSPNGLDVNISLSTTTLNRLKVDVATGVAICRRQQTCYLRLDNGFVADMSGNAILAVDPGTFVASIRAAAFSADTTGPQLLSFELDLGEGLLHLSFDEIVDTDTLDPTALVLVGNSSTLTPSFTLTGGVASQQTQASNCTLIMTEADLLNLKAIVGLATYLNETFLLSSAFVEDSSGNLGGALASPLPASALYTNIQPAQLESVGSFDLRDNKMRLTFSQAVDVDTVQFGRFYVQSTSDGGAGTVSVSLEGDSAVYTDSTKRIIDIFFSRQDLVRLKLDASVGTTINNTYIAMDTTAIRDKFGTAAVAVSPFSALQPLAFVFDTAAPVLESVHLNMSSGILSLVFDDVINASTVTASQFRIQSTGSIGATAYHDLTAVETLSDDGFELELRISRSDLNTIKSLTNLATSSSNTYIRLFEAAVLSVVQGDSVVAATRQASFQADVVMPTVESVAVNTSSLTLTLTFSETINASRANTSRIHLASGSGEFLVLPFSGVQRSMADPSILFVTLSRSEANSLQQQYPLCSSASTCLVTIDAEGIFDMNGNPSIAFGPTPATIFTDDHVRPVLQAFDLSFVSNSNAQLTLSFSEVVNTTQLDLSRLALTDNMSTTIQLTAAVLEPSLTDRVQVNLTGNLLHAIKAPGTIGVVLAHTWLRANDSFVTDTRGNLNSGLSSLLAVSAVVSDTFPVLVTAAALDMSAGTLLLTFDEPINVSTLFASQLTIGTSAGQFRLTGQTAANLSSHATKVTLALLAGDLNQVRALFAAQPTMTLNATNTAVRDVFGNGVDEATTQTPLALTLAVADTTSPTVLSFDLNMTSEILTLHLSEYIRPASVDPSVLTLQAADASRNVTLDVETLVIETQVTSASPFIRIQLSANVIDNAKLQLQPWLDDSSCVLHVAAAFGLDAANNSFEAAQVLSGLISPDTLPPRLLSYDLVDVANSDTVAAELHLNFSEAINASAVDATTILLLRFANDDGVVLSNAQAPVTATAARLLTVGISWPEFDRLRTAVGLGWSISSLYLAHSQLANDTAGNSIVEIESSAPLAVTALTADLVPPSVVAFDLNLSSSVLTLELSEPVNTSALNTSMLRLQASGLSADVSVLLSGSEPVPDSGVLASELGLQLTTEVYHTILRTTSLAMSAATTFFSLEGPTIYNVLEPGATVDAKGNQLIRINASDALAVRTFTPDAVAPRIAAFDLNVQNGTATLVFSEPVQADSLNDATLTLRGGEDVSGTSVALVATAANWTAPTVVVLQLTVTTANQIRATNSIATRFNNTYLHVDSGFALDYNNNSGAAGVLQVRSLFTDGNPPSLVQTLFDVELGVLELSFDEPLNLSSTQPGAITLFSNSSTINYTLPVNATLEGTNDQVLSFALSSAELNIMKKAAVCVSAATCYLTYTENLVKDPERTSVRALQREEYRGFDVFTRDSSRPYLRPLGFVSFDLATANMVLLFNEVVDMASLNASFMTLSSTYNPADSGATLLTLDGATAASSDSDFSLQLQLTPALLANVKASSGLCTLPTNCYVLLGAEALADMSGNPVIASSTTFPGFAVQNLQRDTVPPILTGASLNMQDGVLTLAYDEPVVATPLNGSKIELFASGQMTWRVTLSTEAVVRTPSSSVTLRLSSVDVRAIKSTSLVSKPILLLDAAEGLVEDMANLPNNALASANVTVVVAPVDTRAPQLVSFELDLDEDPGLITFTFNEPVNASSLDATTMLLQPSADNTSSSHAVAACTLEPEYERDAAVDFVFGQTVFACRLSAADQTAIKSNPHLATSLSTTYLSHAGGLVLDMSGNAAGALSNATAQRARLYVGDSTPARLTSFTLDLSLRELRLTFNDVVDPVTLVSSELQLWGNATGAFVAHSLTLESIPVTTSPSYHVVISLSAADFYALTAAAPFHGLNMVYLTMTAAVLDDVLGNDVSAVTQRRPSLLVIPDNSAPAVVAVVLNLTAETVIFTFSESINASALQQGQLSFGDVANTENVTLTDASVVDSDSLETVVSLSLDEESSLRILSNKQLCTSQANCRVLLTSAFASDYSGNALDLTDLASAPLVVVADVRSPTPVGFSANLALETLTLTFSEPMNWTSIDVTSLSVQTSRTMPSATVTLTSDCSVVATQRYGSVGVIQLSAVVAAEVKQDLELLSSANLTWLQVDAAGIRDLAGNENSAAVLAVGVYTADSTAPVLIGVAVDMDAGTMTLEYNEPVNTSSVVADLVQVSQTNGSYSTTLDAATSVATAARLSRVIQLNWTQTDLNFFKASGIFQTQAEGFVRTQAAFVTDRAGNDNEMQMLAVSSYVADATAPRLLGFDLNISTEVPFVELEFSEAVNVSTLRLTSMTFRAAQSNDEARAVNVTLGTLLGVVDAQAHTTVQAQLSALDLLAMKDKGVALTRNTTFLSTLTGFVYDYAGNPSAEVVSSAALQVSNYVGDQTGPELLFAAVDLDAGTLDLTFDEPIANGTLNASGVLLSNVSQPLVIP
ncbi:uncharacterized protein MONBRDRAFT_33612 [Monosiga brevicollis MX1]|uniref:Uncharacterized protein n=1 Tax=Monosiga brevicollis TaxID=81824 RepID=A9V6K1_MONBE|nr:uncharacterized protein MONBRDRAFT_33612 [Monosiga brevicollis MX1]EDQ86748.1 predicted protein [Monosiga brevicollis MX1]|eukprot:XP_001748293.1 hypothetical protein [Monosiga brevicollis MX1]